MIREIDYMRIGQRLNIKGLPTLTGQLHFTYDLKGKKVNDLRGEWNETTGCVTIFIPEGEEVREVVIPTGNLAYVVLRPVKQKENSNTTSELDKIMGVKKKTTSRKK